MSHDRRAQARSTTLWLARAVSLALFDPAGVLFDVQLIPCHCVSGPNFFTSLPPCRHLEILEVALKKAASYTRR